ncbi:hypothetical protein [Streptomyces sp. SGAir0957]
MQRPPTPTRVDSHGNALVALRRRVFTGRVAELRLLRELLLSEERGSFVVWLHGMGGLGKTALLHRFADDVEAQGLTSRTVDLRRTEPSPEAFRAALDAQAPLDEASVLLIDSGESLGPLEQWLRDVFLPSMPTHLLVVVAGRHPPAAEWRTDAQWWHALRSVELQGMDDAEAAVLLRNRDVPESAIPGIVRAGYGLPLALVLLADAHIGQEETAGLPRQWELRDLPEVVRELLRLSLRELPTLAQADALHVLALAAVTTEELVRNALDVSPTEARQLCRWLRELPFVRTTPDGLVPHELMREALVADLRWRGTEGFEQLVHRIGGHYAERLAQGTGDRWASGVGLAALARVNRAVRTATDWRGVARFRLRTARADERDEVLELLRAEHGEGAAELAAQWWDHQPAAFTVTEDRRRLVAVLVAPTLEGDGPHIPDDPVALAALDAVRAGSPLRRTERLLLARWSCGNAPANLAALVTLWATTPGIAVSWTVAAPEDRELSALLALCRHRATPVPDGGGGALVSYAQDWRIESFPCWMAALRTRLPADEPGAAHVAEAEPTPAPLPWPGFAEAVKQAFRSVGAGDTGELAENALLTTRLVQPGADATALRTVLDQTVERLRTAPGTAQLGAVLEITYLSGPRSQQAAASRLGLSFSTYRRRLSAALTKAAELLRERDLYGGVVR